MRSARYFFNHPLDFLSSLVKCFGFLLPDKIYLKWQYYLLMRKKLDLRNPILFSEKLQWLKLNDRNPLYTTMVDKYAVKEYVGEKIGFQYIIPTLGIWDRFEDIEWDELPDKFVLKTTHGGGGTGVVIIDKKKDLNKIKAGHILNRSLKDRGFLRNREWPYKNVPRKIIAEEFLSDGTDKNLDDYKFYCFNGKVKYVLVVKGRNTLNKTYDYFTPAWDHLEFCDEGIVNASEVPEKPELLEKMLEIAEILSHNIPHVRVDMYYVNKNIYFGELTFYDASGFVKYKPEGTDKKLGDLLVLNQNFQNIS